jgi:(p)ppGpp synthase/HD superfamily hydrolase
VLVSMSGAEGVRMHVDKSTRPTQGEKILAARVQHSMRMHTMSCELEVHATAAAVSART